MVGVSAPGRCMLAMASRSAVARACGSRRAIAISSERDELKRREHRGGGGDEDQRDLAVVGQRHGDGRKRRNHQRRRNDVAPPRPAAPGRNRIAKQRRNRHVMGAAERPEREGERREQPIAERQRELGRLQRRRDRQRDDGAERRGDGERQGSAERRARSPRRAPTAAAPARDRSRTPGRRIAPSAFSVAITSRFRSMWLFTALATPTPPTSSAVRPTSVRNWVKCSTLRSSAGVALVRARICQPASGSCALGRRGHRGLAARSLPSGSRRR